MFEMYGIDCSKVQWKGDASVIMVDTYAKRNESFWKDYLTYCEDQEYDPEDPDSKSAWIDDYFNDCYLWEGYEGFLTDVINHECFDGETEFCYEDYILGVRAYIPEGDEDMTKIPTKKKIREILAAYVNPLIEEPVTIEWYDIRE